MPPKRKPLTERIWGKFEQRADNECWPWTAAKTSAGYGHILADGGEDGKRTTVLGHRALYEILVGPIPDGMVLDHTCHTEDEECPGNAECPHRGCVNPAHLEPIDFGENCMRGRGIAPRNAKKTHCHNGHEYTPENTWRDKDGVRACRKCNKARMARWKAKNPDYVSPAKRRAA